MGRLMPGPLTTVAQESISSRLLVDMGVINPDFIPTIFSMFKKVSPLISLLDQKGYKTENVNYGSNFLNGGNFRTVASNHVQYRIAQSDWRCERFRANPSGVTYEDFGNPSYPGLGKNWFYVYLDSNYAGGNEIIILADNVTQLYVIDKTGGEYVSGGVWRYRVKVDGNNKDEYVDTNLMADGVECQVVSSKYTQDWSTGGNEKHTFAGYGDAYLSLQRFKISYSGTAQAMDRNKSKMVTGRFVSNGDYKEQAFITTAQEKMMEQMAKYAEFQILEGKETVSRDTKKVVLTDGEHQEILSGSGIMYSGDGPIEWPLNNGWSPKAIENFLRDADTHVRADETGKRELAIHLHPTAYFNLQMTLKDMGVTQDSNIVGTGDNKIINDTYAGYTLGGLTLLIHRSDYLAYRPGLTLKDGTKSNEWDAMVFPLGLTGGGQRGIQLIQLRPMSNGKVAGIDKGGNMSNDIDGSTEHALIQIGVISQIQPFKIYRPYKNNLI